MSTFSTNLKVSTAVAGAQTVPANCYAIVEYYRSGYNQNNAGANVEYTPNISTRHFGPYSLYPLLLIYSATLILTTRART